LEGAAATNLNEPKVYSNFIGYQEVPPVKHQRYWKSPNPIKHRLSDIELLNLKDDDFFHVKGQAPSPHLKGMFTFKAVPKIS